LGYWRFKVEGNWYLLPYHFVCAGDDDPAGLKFFRTFRDGFVSHDLDELSVEEVRMLANQYL